MSHSLVSLQKYIEAPFFQADLAVQSCYTVTNWVDFAFRNEVDMPVYSLG